MSNMSYCRFRNTLMALQDCYDAMGECGGEDLSKEEAAARDRLIKLCGDIANDFIDDVVDDDDRAFGNNRRR